MQISRITNNILCLVVHKIIGIHELLIYDTVFGLFFFFSCLHRIKKTVVREEEMNVLKSTKYLYTEVIT